MEVPGEYRLRVGQGITIALQFFEPDPDYAGVGNGCD